MKTGVLILLDILDLGGAENLAANIAIKQALSGKFNPVICATRTGGIELENKLNQHNIKYYILGRHSRYELYKFLSVRNIIKDENIKLIHSHKLGSNFWGGILGKLFGLPVISHFHAHHKTVEKSTDLFASKVVNLLSDKIISISEFERTRLIEEEGISPSKIVTIYNGINYRGYNVPGRNEIKEELGIDSSKRIVAIVAAFRKQKNHEMFLLSAREILRTRQDVLFLIVGDGTEKREVLDTAVELGVYDNCIFTGVRQNIPDILSMIDVGVLSSHWEGLPLVVLEYMAAKKPVVSTAVSGISEVIEDGVNGLLVPPDDYRTLAQKINSVLDDKALAESLGKNGFKTVSERFSEESMMNKIESVYEDVLSNHN